MANDLQAQLDIFKRDNASIMADLKAKSNAENDKIKKDLATIK
jgi:hypothetical protein